MVQDADAAGQAGEAAAALRTGDRSSSDPKPEATPGPAAPGAHGDQVEALQGADWREAAASRAVGRLADHRPFQVSAQAGETRLVSSTSRRDLALAASKSFPDTYEIDFRWRAADASPLSAGVESASWTGGFCTLYREREDAPDSRARGDGGASFELPYKRAAAILESLIDQPLRRQIEFAATVSLATAQGAAAARAAAFVEQELAIQGGLPTPSPFGAALEDLLIRALLTQLPHNYSTLLQRGPRQAAPFNVKRAEAFMRAHADEPLKIELIAEVAGCSVRSLQSAFLKFVGCTPMQRLRRIRLELARGELERADREHSVAELAARYGFSNPGRFARHYRAAFGHPPSRSRPPA